MSLNNHEAVSPQDVRASQRTVYRVFSWIVTLLVPVVLVLTAVRLLMNPVFLSIEYHMPGFPEDRYGFTTEDRLYWSAFALDYLTNAEDISYLADLEFDNGQPIYNQRELKHMVDVKIAVRGTLLVWYISVAAVLGLGIWAWRGGWLVEYKAGLARGGWLTVFLLAGAIVFVIASFGIFFVTFHNVFFDPGTWIFNYSDTLIRLFPERFWRDIFIYVGIFSIAAGLALGLGFRTEKM